MSRKQPAVYLLANGERGTLYVGITGWLKERIHEHREGAIEGFTRKHGIKRLVWFEFHEDFPSAIQREKQMKSWNRAWKLELVERHNPKWRDLWEDLLD